MVENKFKAMIVTKIFTLQLLDYLQTVKLTE